VIPARLSPSDTLGGPRTDHSASSRQRKIEVNL